MWAKLKGIVGAAAPLLGTALGGPAAGAVAGMIASALGVEDKPEALEAAIAADPQALLRLKELEKEREVELRRLVLEAETRRLAEETRQLAEVNQTIRAELASPDRYKGYWRPTFGYAAAVTWTVQMAGATAVTAYAVMAHPSEAATIIDALAGLLSASMVLWGIALSVLGVQVIQRSKDKARACGQTPAGVVDVLARLTGKGG